MGVVLFIFRHKKRALNGSMIGFYRSCYRVNLVNLRIKRKKSIEVILLRLRFLIWRVSGIDMRFLALLWAFENVNYAGYSSTFETKCYFLTVISFYICFGFLHPLKFWTVDKFVLLTCYVSFSKKYLAYYVSEIIHIASYLIFYKFNLHFISHCIQKHFQIIKWYTAIIKPVV